MSKFLASIDLLLAWLDGKKTYIISAIAGGTAAAEMCGVHIPTGVYIIEGALGLGSMRAAIAKRSA